MPHHTRRLSKGQVRGQRREPLTYVIADVRVTILLVIQRDGQILVHKQTDLFSFDLLETLV